MKIVLAAINAKYIHSNLAVYSLKACGERVCDGDISIAEFTINNYIDDILPRLYKERPDVLAFSCYIWNISMVEELAELIHKAAPWVNLWLGGPEVSYDAEDVLTRNPAVKLVMCGEGEDTFAQLAAKACDNDARLSDEELEKIAGIVFKGYGIEKFILLHGFSFRISNIGKLHRKTGGHCCPPVLSFY